ncbi:ribosomal protein L7Ae family protein [Clostridium carboxidivorans P7]|uniref:Ribosomal protein L7Ae/L30e/S12e/Gadd45 n=1 Tax=Clostridium carboxidivorans P7 TaxID=536227 RepID=C6PQX1_9CLOT|nr:50S ribosomal protein L7ae-like protein [Clostridium carboxidivorans]AKN29470.1 ribosomal protein L7Ae family protein [Clostridium carboxidivorans P7]EET88335.1 ribosomal protein L7Ae/L30e/S12e/Gadd45 [Clostridium carboxidivorans P7]EFG89608.1 ribosomal protein L7Ae [Clostridium carboxidivorans P7]
MENKFFQFLGLTKRAGKVLEGYNKCEDALKRRKAYLIIISEDASQNTVNKFLNYSEKYKIPVLQGYNKEDLGKALGMEQIKILGVSDKRMSERLLVLWKECEKI